MSTQPQTQGPAPSRQPPFHGFNWSGLVQICQALRDPGVMDRVMVGPLSFDQLAWEPRRNGRPMREVDLDTLRERLQFFFAMHGQTKWRASTEDIARAVLIVARENLQHPVTAHLSTLSWDGEPRLTRVAAELLGVNPKRSPHSAGLIRKWFLAAVARAYNPGGQADPVLTLVGRTPSTNLFFRLLVPPALFADLPSPLDPDTTPAQLRTSWIWQRDDLPQLAERDPEAVAALLGGTDDPVESVFTADDERAPRTTLLVARVEAFPDLRDEALRRRFWLIPVGDVDTTKLAAWAPQLWAEAREEHLTGATWTLTPEESAALARSQYLLSESDPWETMVEDYLVRQQSVSAEHRWPSLAQVMKIGLGLKAANVRMSDQRRVGAILRRMGYEPVRVRVKDARKQIWRPRPDLLGAPSSEDESTVATLATLANAPKHHEVQPNGELPRPP